MSCTPCVCDTFNLGVQQCLTSLGWMELPPRLGQLYSGLYTIGTYIPKLTNNVPEILQSNVTTWLIESEIIRTLSWTVVLIVLYFVLSAHGTIPLSYAIILMIFTLIIATLNIVFILLDTSFIFTNLPSQIQDQFISNFNQNSTALTNDFFQAYNFCKFCPGSSNQICQLYFENVGSCGGICQTCPVSSNLDELLNNLPNNENQDNLYCLQCEK